jgi:uncharacterized protein (TIGR00730 family)
MKKVAIFGSARPDSDSGLYNAVRKLARKLANHGWVIVTGGGPGSMEAANRGAMEATKGKPVRSLAQAINLPFEQHVNDYVQSHEEHDTFYTRLEYFSHCDAFIITPGGIGTLLEYALIYQLVQVNHIEKKPIICVGRMWRKLFDWLQKEMVDSNFLTNEELELVHYVDRFDEAVYLLEGISKKKTK